MKMETITYEQDVRQRTAKRLRMSVSEVEHIIDTYVDEHIKLQREHYARAQADSEALAEQAKSTTDPAVAEQWAEEARQSGKLDCTAADFLHTTEDPRETVKPGELDKLDEMLNTIEHNRKHPESRKPRTPRKSRAKAPVPDEPTTAQVIHGSAG